MSKYEKVIESNIQVHSRLAAEYNKSEPHFRPENIDKVRQRIVALSEQYGSKRLLDLGCGTGFIIKIAKEIFSEIEGVDVTEAMLKEVDKSGPCKITLHRSDSGKFESGSTFDIVTSYSFLHHLYDVEPTFQTAYRSLKNGGVYYVDLDPNYYFWEKIHCLEVKGKYHSIIRREIDSVMLKDEEIKNNFGVEKEVFNQAEYGKNIKGGFKEEELIKILNKVGFTKVEFFYHWFLGEAFLINDPSHSRDQRLQLARVMTDILNMGQPLTRSLFKYLGFYAYKE